jgi:hypothetical protein
MEITFFSIYGRDGSSHRPKDLGVVSASFILVPVCSSREKKELTAFLKDFLVLLFNFSFEKTPHRRKILYILKI